MNEISRLAKMLQSADLPENIPVKVDKGYQSKKNANLLTKRNLKNHMLKKAKKNLPLNHWEKKFNKIVTKIEEEQQEIGLFRPIGEQKSRNYKTNRLGATVCNGLMT